MLLRKRKLGPSWKVRGLLKSYSWLCKGHHVAPPRVKGQQLSYFYDKKEPVVKTGNARAKTEGKFSILCAN